MATLVGVATDRCSGADSVWARPSLGRWLTDAADEWDWLVADTVDRVTENLADAWRLLGWCHTHGKVFITVDGLINTSETRPPSEWIELIAEGIRMSCGLQVSEKRLMINELDEVLGLTRKGGGEPRLLTHSRIDRQRLPENSRQVHEL